MNSFFDVFKWDRFVAPSAMELLFWLVSDIAVLFGVWGLFAGIAMVEGAPVPGLVLIAVSIIGTLAGIVAARIACEAVVILFRVNENLMDIAERGFTAMPAQIVESAAVRLEHRTTEPREEQAPARRQAERTASIIEELPQVFDAAEDEDEAADPFAPDHGRVEPKAWDVRPVETKAAAVATDIIRSEPQQRMRDVTPAAAERSADARTERRAQEPRAEARSAEPAPQAPSQAHAQARTEPKPDRTAPAVAQPDVSDSKPPVREPSRRRPAASEPPIEHALKRLSQPSGVDASQAAPPTRERRMPAARADDVDFIASTDLGRSEIEEPRPVSPRRRPAAEEDVTALPAFLALRSEPEPPPIELPPLPRQQARRSNGDGSEQRESAPDAKATAPRTVREKTVAPAAVADARGESRQGERARPQKPKGGQAPLKRRRPRRDRDDG